MSTMKWLFDQEYVTKIHEDSLKKDAFEQGMQQGIDAFNKLIKLGKITINDAAKALNITPKEFKTLASV